jgi:CheY-like chemotaxis protein
VHVVTGADGRRDVLRAGAVAFFEKPVSQETLERAFADIESFVERGVKRLLIVEDDEEQRRALTELAGEGDDVEVTAVGSGEEALASLAEERFDCVVLDLKLPGTTGFDLLEQLKNDERFRDLPVIVYTGKELTRPEETRLRRYAEAIVVKDVRTPERLLDETALFLHRVENTLPSEKRRTLEQLHGADAVFRDRKVLIVDDDIRNVFALTSVLEAHGMRVVFAETGKEALALLEANADIDLVLLDIMLPEMDGYETVTRIREQKELEALPVIALTAKAMKGDREKSIAAGASDYIAKPVDTDQLLSLMRVWLYE